MKFLSICATRIPLIVLLSSLTFIVLLSLFASHRLKQVYNIGSAVVKMSESREAVRARYLAQYPNATPIVAACEKGNLDDVKVLLTVNNKNVVGRDSRGGDWTPLMIAARFEHFQVVEYLIEQGADPNIARSNGNNALHYAAGHNRTTTELIELLLTHMSLNSINKKARGGWTPLDRAYYENHSPLRQEIIALLRSAGGKANYYDENGEYVGVGNGDLNTTDNNNNNNNNTKRPREESNDGGSNKKMKQMNLLKAAKEGRTEVVKLLLENGANVKQADNDGETPLHFTAKRGHTEIAKLLLDNGAEVNQADKRGKTPLHTAAFRGRTEVVALLLEKGANIHAKDKYGKTPLHKAANVEIAKLLLDKGADINAKDNDGQTPLHFTAYYGHTEIAKLLLDNGAEPNIAETEYGYTPLHVAANKGHTEVVKLLLAAGANIDAKTNSGKTPLHHAADYGHYEVCKLLLENGANVKQADNDGETPLHKAAYYGHADIVKLLLDNGAEVNQANKYGLTPLHFTADKGLTEVVKLLLAAGADITKLNERQKSWVPRDLGAVKNCIICMESLSSKPSVRTPCGHLFHRKCLQEWMSYNRTCPKCRKRLAIGVDQMGRNLIGNDTDGYHLCKNIRDGFADLKF